MKEQMDLAQATMRSFILCPFFVVTSDTSCLHGANVSTISYVGVLSEQPPIIGLAVRPECHTHALILENKLFTLNLPSQKLLADMDFCGTFSGKTHGKIFLRKLEMEKIGPKELPAIKNSPLALTCSLKTTLFLSRNGASHDYFIADILSAHAEEGFRIEEHRAIVTANRDYRLVAESLGQAFHLWRV
ncbi:MAG: flavin reductase [Patescibacteria group bacterium]